MDELVEFIKEHLEGKQLTFALDYSGDVELTLRKAPPGLDLYAAKQENRWIDARRILSVRQLQMAPAVIMATVMDLADELDMR